MDELLDALGFDTEDGDFGQLTNDENGCIYFNTDFIKTNDIKEPGLEACDLPINDKTIKIDSSNMRFKPKSFNWFDHWDYCCCNCRCCNNSNRSICH